MEQGHGERLQRGFSGPATDVPKTGRLQPLRGTGLAGHPAVPGLGVSTGENMQIQVRHDNHIQGQESLQAYVQSVIEASVDRFAERITRIEAHLGDANGDKSGSDDMRCMLEARVSGVKTIAVTHQAESLSQAIDGAADKLAHALESSIGKLDDKSRRAEGLGHVSADVAAGSP
jgi:ribosome-associated translation inhibitor RaiA